MNDIFRLEYKELNDDQSLQVIKIKEKSQELFDLINSFVPSDERSERARLVSAGKTGIEVYVGAIIKGITTPQK